VINGWIAEDGKEDRREDGRDERGAEKRNVDWGAPGVGSDG
jgi:hypothetical protein